MKTLLNSNILILNGRNTIQLSVVKLRKVHPLPDLSGPKGVTHKRSRNGWQPSRNNTALLRYTMRLQGLNTLGAEIVPDVFRERDKLTSRECNKEAVKQRALTGASQKTLSRMLKRSFLIFMKRRPT